MKLNNKILLTLLVAPAALMTACSPSSSDDDVAPGGDGSEITIWCSETTGVADSFKALAESYAKEKQLNYPFKVVGVTEAEAATQMLTDVSAGADIYCFAQDQFSRLVEGGALSKLGKSATTFVNNNNTSDSVRAATSGESVYAYPITADNGYFMYYDKSVITDETHLGSLEKLIEDCEAAGKNFSMEMGTSAWYLAAFFMAYDSNMTQLCHSSWKTNDKGAFTGYDDNWNSDNGVIAAKGIQKLVKSTSHNSSSAAADFKAATPSAVLVSGTWAYNDVKAALGDNMGVAELPSFTVNNKTYHLGSYSGYKLLGVKPNTDATKLSHIHKIAQALSNYDGQVDRLKKFGWGPSNKKAQETDDYKNNPALVALSKQNVYSTAQPNIHGSWWDIAKVIGTSLKEVADNDDAGIKAVLKKYEDALKALFTMSDAEKRAFTVIGKFGTAPATDYAEWKSDLAMTEDPTNTWISPAITLAEGDEFKVRQGKSWDVAFGNAEGKNYTVSATEAGTKKIKLVTTVDADGKVTGGTVSLVAA